MKFFASHSPANTSTNTGAPGQPQRPDAQRPEAQRPDAQGANTESVLDAGILAEVSTSAKAALLATAPAFLALVVAAGVGVYALAHTVALPEFTAQLWLALAVALANCAVNCYGTTRRLQLPPQDARRRMWAFWQGLSWIVALLLAVLPPICVVLHVPLFVPADVATDNNLLVAVFMGWFTVACIMFTGVLMGPVFGPSRPVPFSVALLPELSLFGLLHIVSVDTPVMVAFMVYTAATLYLLAYESYLVRKPFSNRTLSSSTPSHAAEVPLAGRVRKAAGHYIVACGVWLTIFSVGAGLLYGPLSVLLPWSLSVDFVRSRLDSREETRDWRDATRVMELRGGAYPLSDRPVMRVRIEEGESRSLWRGRVYEQYSGRSDTASRWEIFAIRGEGTYEEIPAKQQAWIGLKATKSQVKSGLQRSLPPLRDNMATRKRVTERFSLLEGFSGGAAVPVYTSGEPVAVNTSYETIALRTDGTARMADGVRGRRIFRVRSQVIEPNLAKLSNAPGLDTASLENWRKDEYTAPTLQLPGGETNERLRQIVAQIRRDARLNNREMRTPYHKTVAISRYLIDHCEYSLATPSVPPGEDSVIFFLTQSRQGACDMFASAMALLLRTMDVPARVASGFRQPEIPEDPEGKSFLVRERDAHAWVEYFVPDLGWMSYDPTDGTHEANNSLGAQVLNLLHLSQLRNQGHLLVVPALGVLLLLTGGAWTLLDKRKAARPAMIHINTPDDNTRQRIRSTYVTAKRALARHVRGPAGQTPHEYEATVLSSDISPEAKQELSALTYLFVMANYSTASLANVVNETHLRASLQRLRRALR
ncbi:MAG TPA: transglutaminase-like domain-containing protein [Abditibacteriaceae bacterium]